MQKQVKNSVSKKVDFLIVGTDGENTGKHKRAMELQEQGHQIIIGSALQFFTKDEMKNANKTSAKADIQESSEFEDDNFEEDDKPKSGNTFGCILGVVMLLIVILYFMF